MLSLAHRLLTKSSARSTFRRLPFKNNNNAAAVVCRALHLSPRESDHLCLHNAGRLAQYRLARGVKLNVPESIALITMQMMEHIRDGTHSVADLMGIGQSLLGVNNVMPGVASLVNEVQIEATFPDGTKLLTVHSPISSDYGNLEQALYGSFLPVPDDSVFSLSDEGEVTPGAVLTTDENEEGIEINQGRNLIELSVTNTGDRPIQVGSHYAFVETNKALVFDRRAAIHKRLNVPSGASVRFEPGESKTVTLVDIGGKKNVVTGNLLTNGESDEESIMKRVTEGGFGHVEASVVPVSLLIRLSFGVSLLSSMSRVPCFSLHVKISRGCLFTGQAVRCQ